MKKITEAAWNSLRPVLYYGLPILLLCGIFAWFDKPVLNWILEHTWTKVTAVWVIFSLFSGWFEAYYYNAKVRSNIDLKIDEHIIWNGIRFFVWLPLVMIDWKTSLLLVGVFPFIHDGKYYAMRRKLQAGVYVKGFWSNPSSESTAIVDLSIWSRSSLFLISSYLIIHFNHVFQGI